MSTRKDLIERDVRSPEMVRRIPVFRPVVDIFENEEEILLHADMPGVLKEDIAVNIDNGKLYLSGIRKMESDGAPIWEELGELEYTRTFSVPQTIAVDKVNAELKEGVLKLHLPKSEAAKPRKIEIKTA